MDHTPFPLDSTIADRYLLKAVLGSGGAGVVYQAQDLRQEQAKDCAVKVLFDKANHALDIYSFKREFRAASRLSHPFCVKVFEMGEESKHWFYTMEYVSGGSVKNKKLSLSEILRLALQTLAALDHLHSRQIIHRDIKPQNILVDIADETSENSLEAKLTDFGIAKVGGMDEAMVVGQLVGTLQYLSPEQALGEPLDPRSDLYSFGLVLYELLAGHPCFQLPKGSPSEAWLAVHRNTLPIPLLQISPQVPETIAQIVMQLLAKDPSQRYRSAAAVHDRLLQFYMENYPLEQAQHVDAPPLARRPYLAAPRFVGREKELRQFEEFLGTTQKQKEKSSGVLMISGEAGLGKSRLLNQLVRMIQSQDALLFIGTCRSEPGVAYQPLAFLLRALGVMDKELSGSDNEPTEIEEDEGNTLAAADSVDAFADAKTLTAAKIAELRTILDSKEEKQPNVNETLQGDFALPVVRDDSSLDRAKNPEDVLEDRKNQQRRFYQNVLKELIMLSRHKVCVVLIEDAQWADAPTLDLLGFLVQGVETARVNGETVRVAFVITHRPAPDNMVLGNFKRQVEGAGMLLPIDLRPLDLPASAELVASILAITVTEDVKLFTARLLEKSSGNPLYLAQILHTLLASGQLVYGADGWNIATTDMQQAQIPLTIHDAIGDRAARFSSATKTTIASATVIGRRFSVELLRAVQEIEMADVLDNLDEAIRAGFVEEIPSQPGLLQFVHDRFREAIYEKLPAEQKVAIHGKIAVELERTSSHRPEIAADLAHHFFSAGNLRKAYFWNVKAGEQAVKQNAFHKEAEYFGTALDLSRRLGEEEDRSILLRYATACAHSGKYDAAKASYERALELQEGKEEKTEILARLAELEYRRGDTKSAEILLQKVLQSIGIRIPSGTTSLFCGIFKQALIRTIYNLFPKLAQIKKYSPLEKSIFATSCRIMNLLGEIYYLRDYRWALFHSLLGYNTAERLGESPELSRFAAQHAIMWSGFGFKRFAEKHIARSKAISDRVGRLVDKGMGASIRGVTQAQMGEFPDALKSFSQAAHLFRQSSDFVWLLQTYCFWSALELVAGDLPGAVKHARAILESVKDFDDLRGKGWGWAYLGFALRRGGVEEGVEELLRKSIQALERGGDSLSRLIAECHLVLYLSFHEKLDEAVSLGAKSSKETRVGKFRYYVLINDGAFLTAAAMLLQRKGRLDWKIRWAVYRTMWFRRSFARVIKFTSPVFWAGCAAWALACGKKKKAARLFTKAVQIARNLDANGEWFEVHNIASHIYPIGSEEQQYHSQQAKALNQSMAKDLSAIKIPED